MTNSFSEQNQRRLYDTLISEGQSTNKDDLFRLDSAQFMEYLICAIFLKVSKEIQKLNKL